MSFIVDRQTQDDLNLFGTGRKGSIFSLFNRTRTRGGAEVLKQIFSFPLSDTQRIEERSKAIAVLQRENVTFDFSGEWFDAAEFYLNQAEERKFQVDSRKDLRQRLNRLLGGDSAMDAVIAGISGIRDIVVCLDRL
ncbi:MAG: DNA mismatch repair protein, partial [Muribaculaceae bacterium]|nr:DNA mismatch repair protein [Muribaculaceae bacterium]